MRGAGHPQEEILESAVRGRLSDEDLDELVQHLLVCGDCQVLLLEAMEKVAQEGGVQ